MRGVSGKRCVREDVCQARDVPGKRCARQKVSGEKGDVTKMQHKTIPCHPAETEYCNHKKPPTKIASCHN